MGFRQGARRIWLPACITAAAVLAGCTVFQTVGQRIRGEYFLENQKYESGLASFRDAVRESPQNAQAHYYLGRFLMARDQSGEAVGVLQKAVRLSPDNADYRFWLGLAFGAQGDRAQEKKAYEAALRLDPDNVQALMYLGHNLLAKGEYEPALSHYEKVLEISPEAPSALYNRAVVFGKIGRSPEEKAAYKRYLDIYPDGAFSRQAVAHLNRSGDFTYRIYTLGHRKVAVKQIAFEPFKSEIDRDVLSGLDLIGAVISNNREIVLHVVVYRKGNPALAKERAERIRSYLCDKGGIARERIRISWFDQPETIRMGKRVFVQNAAVQIFAIPKRHA